MCSLRDISTVAFVVCFFFDLGDCGWDYTIQVTYQKRLGFAGSQRRRVCPHRERSGILRLAQNDTRKSAGVLLRTMRANLTPNPFPENLHPRGGRRSLSRERARVSRCSGDIEGKGNNRSGFGSSIVEVDGVVL